MMLLYGMLRGISAALRMVAEWKHARVKAAYEDAENTFKELEAGCKAEEVALGRPVDYADQLRLLKSYERKEAARKRWMRAAARVAQRNKVDGRLRQFSEMRLPYTFGLIDMACVMRVLDYFGLTPEFEQSVFQSLTALF